MSPPLAVRGETFIFATPEVQNYREEIAPMPDRSRDAIPHIAEAAERDRAQLAAHDAALGSHFSGLPTAEPVARREELRIAANREAKAERQLCDLRERVGGTERQIERYDSQRRTAQKLKRRLRKDELARIERDDARSLQRLADFPVEVRELAVPSGAAREELTVRTRARSGVAPAYGLRYAAATDGFKRGDPMATGGEKSWPRVGRLDGRPWGILDVR